MWYLVKKLKDYTNAIKKVRLSSELFKEFGVYKSENQGASWTKMSDAVAGGTGPHYYQELYASPHNYDEIYLADNYMQVSFDGGKTFSRMNETEKHVDNHAVAFKSSDKNYILVGCDGGLYESFDKTKNWKFIDNFSYSICCQKETVSTG